MGFDLQIVFVLYVMERDCLSIVQSLAETRRNFFRRSQMYRRDQEEITLNFIAIEREYLEILTRVLDRSRTLTVHFPLTIPTGIPADFMEPVPVVPTPEQINAEIVDYIGTTQAACAVCQEGIVSGGCQLRSCLHVYHRECIQMWFCASSLCPVCRRDIRGGQEAQTSSVSSGTPPQEMSQ
jgi:hypothetical protein